MTWSWLLKHSANGRETWSLAKELPAGIFGPVKNRPLLLENGIEETLNM